MATPCTLYATAAELVACEAFTGDEPTALEYVTEASEILYSLLAHVIHGICTVTVQTDGCSFDSWPYVPYRLLDGWMRPNPPRIALMTPVVDITSVSEGGVALAPADYVLMDGMFLQRADGATWTGMVVIVYEFGAPIPLYVTDAALELAIELWKDRCGGSSCLPKDVTGVNRQGVTLSFDRNVDRVREAGPSLEKVTVAMATANPTNQRVPSDVWSPDDEYPLHSLRTFP